MSFGTTLKAVGAVTRKLSVKTVMKVRKASPELLLAAGIVVGGAAIVTACIGTKKIVENKTIEKTKNELDDIQKKCNEGKIDKPEKKTTSLQVYKHFGYEMAKAYGLPLFLFILSVGCILASHGILKNRYISTTLAYKALDEAYKDYRARVREAVGEEKELHLFNGTEEGGETIIIDENGESTSYKENVKIKDKKNSPYEFDFNAKTAPGNWEANTDYNLMFLRGVENYLNDLLVSRGHVFVNEALDALGLKRTPEGSVTGWLYGHGGDDYVDLGFSEYYTDEYSDINDGYIQNIHLNFNVDGLIWDKI